MFQPKILKSSHFRQVLKNQTLQGMTVPPAVGLRVARGVVTGSMKRPSVVVLDVGRPVTTESLEVVLVLPLVLVLTVLFGLVSVPSVLEEPPPLVIVVPPLVLVVAPSRVFVDSPFPVVFDPFFREVVEPLFLVVVD